MRLRRSLRGGVLLVLGVVLGIVGARRELVAAHVQARGEPRARVVVCASAGRCRRRREVVVVGISRDAARAVGQTTELDTWPRDLHAQLLDRLTADGASAIAFDLMFHEPRARVRATAFRGFDRAGRQRRAARVRRESDVLPLGGELGGMASRHARRRCPSSRPPRSARRRSSCRRCRSASDSSGRSAEPATTRRRCPSSRVQAHLLPHYEDFVALARSARGRARRRAWPQTRAAVQAAAQPRAHDDDDSPDAFRATAPCALRRSASSSAALPGDGRLGRCEALLDLYAGPSSRFLNFYGPARSVPTLPYDRALAGRATSTSPARWCSSGCRSRGSRSSRTISSPSSRRAPGVNLSGVELGATAVANLLEQRALAPLPLPLHVALVVALGVAFGTLVARSTMLRAAASRRSRGAALFRRRVLAVHELLRLAAAARAAARAVAGRASARRSGGTIASSPQQRERVRTALGYYVPQSLARRLTEQTLSPGRQSAAAARHVSRHRCGALHVGSGALDARASSRRS